MTTKYFISLHFHANLLAASRFLMHSLWSACSWHVELHAWWNGWGHFYSKPMLSCSPHKAFRAITTQSKTRLDHITTNKSVFKHAIQIPIWLQNCVRLINRDCDGLCSFVGRLCANSHVAHKIKSNAGIEREHRSDRLHHILFTAAVQSL